ncbi:MAG: 16S rRNA (guanine(966)-N(2))-methyltransferase RsmD [Eubacteriales bacterium]|nr:16S rRNA (guanine(966)-N(2))-methyltransferase RsmD [Eubacteriales bacterium]
MRIIAGEKRSMAIAAPKGQDTRPTQDYIRESLFNILRAWLPDARVLDLFAGSGALGLEALSRGAAEAVLNDRSADASAVIRQNVTKLGYEEKTTLLRCEWHAALERLRGRQFDLVFLDPPYRMTETGEMCAAMVEMGLLAEGARVVIEHAKGGVPEPGERFACADVRRYGDTEIHFFDFEGA